MLRRSRIFDYDAFSRRDGKTGNLKLTQQLHRSVEQLLFPLSRRIMLSAWTSNLTGRSSNGHIMNLPIFHDSWYADTVFWGRFIGWGPHSTQSKPLLTRIFDDTTPTKCRFKARLQICNNLAWRLALHLWPRGIHRAANDAIRIGSSFRQHRTTRSWQEI